MPRRASLNHSSVLPPWCSCSPTGSHGPSKISPRRVAPHPQSLRLLTIAALEDGNWQVLGDTPSICAAPSSFLTFGIPSLTCRCVHGCNRFSYVCSLLPSRFVCCLPESFVFHSFPFPLDAFPLPYELPHLITLLEMD
jgi:hypothetical protein